MNKSLSVPARHPVWVVIITSILVILLSLISHSGPIHAQQGGQVQLLTGRAEPGAGSFYLLPNLKRGQTLYVYAQGTSGSLDPLLLLSDKTLDRFKVGEEFRAEVERAIAAGRDPLEVVPEFADQFFAAWDDDSGLGYAAALEYPIPADGDYKLAVITTPAKDTSGQFRLLIGLDTPDVLSGNAEVTGDTIAVLDEENTQANVTVQEITGTLTAEDPTTFFELNPVKAGDTLYVFAEATSGDLAPIIILTDFGDKPLATGNFSGQQTEGTLQFVFDEDGSDYRLRIGACCEDGSQTAGDYRLLVGVNAPEVMTGRAEGMGQPVVRLPKTVKAGVKLQQITGVDQKSENYGAVASLQLEWQDPALAFSPDSCNCRFKIFRGDSFYQFATTTGLDWPEFTLFNQQGNRWTQNRVVVITPDGNATYFERFSTTFQAPDFNFELFPFDKQDFFIRVDSLYPVEFFNFENDPTFTEVGTQLGEEEWYITNSDTSVTSEILSTQSTTSRYSFHFEARRHLNFYIFRIFVPLAIIIIISWVTFFLKDYGKRVDVASGNMLLFIAFNFTISNDLPRLGYLTLMDRFLVSTFVVTGLVLVFNVYLKRLELTGKESFAQRIDKYMIWIYPLAYIVAFGVVTLFFT
jgi:hypothetical protein